jgi:hypothetical protein
MKVCHRCKLFSLASRHHQAAVYCPYNLPTKEWADQARIGVSSQATWPGPVTAKASVKVGSGASNDAPSHARQASQDKEASDDSGRLTGIVRSSVDVALSPTEDPVTMTVKTRGNASVHNVAPTASQAMEVEPLLYLFSNKFLTRNG